MIQLDFQMPVAQAAQAVKGYREKVRKAQDDAVRVEGYRRMVQLRREIRAAAPGGRRFAPLSMIRRTMRAAGSGRLRADKPLVALGHAIGYETNRGQSPIEFKFGFVGPASSSAWRRLADMHQRGFTRRSDGPYDPKYPSHGTLRETFAREGGRIDYKRYGRRKAKRRNVFFLRKETGDLQTPARPIIAPFLSATRAATLYKIRENFRRKMRGERI